MKDGTSTPLHRILVIDDNVAIHEDFRKILAKKTSNEIFLDNMESTIFGSKTLKAIPSHFEIDCASQGEEGLKMLEQAMADGRPYSLAFVDGRMPPGWDGIETISRLWQVCPDLQVVLCTAYADYSWQEIRGMLGESDSLLILKKPFDNVEVLQMTHALTRKWELNHEVRRRIDTLGQNLKKSNKEKERISALLEAAFEHSPSGIIVFDAQNYSTIWSNSSAIRICGSKNIFHPDTKDSDCLICHKDGSPYIQEEMPLYRVIRNGDIIQKEEIMICNSKEGNKFISLNAAPIRVSDGKISAGIIIFEDITQLKKAEEEKRSLQKRLYKAEKMEALGLLAGGVAHDLNNVLSVVGVYAELLLREIGESRHLKSLIEKILAANDRAAAIIDDMLMMARRGVRQRSVFDINDTINDYLNMPEFENLCKIHGKMQVEVNLSKEPLPIMGSQIHLIKIIMNLTQNAAEAMPDGGRLTISTFRKYLNEPLQGYHEIRPGEYAVLSVADTGKGINTADINHIFEPFYTTKVMGKSGTGLGLAVVYGVVKDHDGYIDVVSKEGEGTIFILYFPINRHEVATRDEPSATSSYNGSGESILIIDDNLEQVLAVSEMLKRLNYNVHVVSSGEEALVFLKHRKVDIVLLDMIMDKGMDGLDTFRNIIKIHPGQKTIIVTGFAETDRVRTALALGASSLVKKPYSIEELALAIRKELNPLDGQCSINNHDR